MASQKELKACETCGRKIEYRKKWAKNWDQVKYCSDRCRQNKVSDTYEAQLLEALRKLTRGQTIDPSDLLLGALREDLNLAEKVKAAARRLVAKGDAVILQNNREVDPSSARGAIRLKLITKS